MGIKTKVGLTLLCALASTQAFAIVSATLPASRSVQVNSSATIFATIINPADTTASGCRISLQSDIDADLFFQTTDPATNALIGQRDEPVDIGPGAAQSFLVGVTPRSSFSATDVAFNFSCDNTDAAPSFSGLNTLLLSASTVPVPDIVAIALTPSGNGVAELPKENNLGFFSMATVNVGAPEQLQLTARAANSLDGNLLVCETNPATGACLAPPSTALTTQIDSSATPTFAVFASSFLALPLDPANGRIFVEFADTNGQIRGSTSVAVSGGGPDVTALFGQTSEGELTLPTSPTADQFRWIVDQIRLGNPSISELESRLSPAFNPQDIQNFINSLHQSYPNLSITEFPIVTPLLVSGIADNGGTGQPITINITTRLSDGLISLFGVTNFSGSSIRAQDQNLTAQAVTDLLATSADGVSLMVARVNSANQCVPVLAVNEDIPRGVGSTFKIYVLAALASAVNDGVVGLEQILPLDAGFFAPGDNVSSEPAGTALSVLDHARLMIGTSDNTTTDHLHNLAGRARLDQAVRDLGHTNPDILTPLLSINQNFSLFRVLQLDEALAYLNGSEAQQQQTVIDRLEPIGSLVNNSAATLFNDTILATGTWQASPVDLCNAMTNLRTRYPVGTDAFRLINEAMSSAAPFPNIRSVWDRVWFKGGSLASGVTGVVETRVLTFAWFVESAARGRYVVVGEANNPLVGGIDNAAFGSRLTRLLELVATGQVE